MIEFEIIIASVFAGVLYSVLWWGAKNVDPTKPSPAFDWFSLVSTAIIGAGVGIAAALSGSPITQIGIETQIAALGAIIAIIEKVLKTLYRYLENRFVGAQNVA